MVEFLIEKGADATAKDQERGGSPAGWAAYGGHDELKAYLEQIAKAQIQRTEQGMATPCDPTRINWPNNGVLFIIRADNLQEDLS